jgi:hypothetical protein
MSIINVNISKVDMIELENHVKAINKLIKEKFSCYQISVNQDSFKNISISVYDKLSSHNISTFENELKKVVSDCSPEYSIDDKILKQAVGQKVLDIIENYSNSSSGVTKTLI